MDLNIGEGPVPKASWRSQVRQTLAVFIGMPKGLRLVWEVQPALTIFLGIVTLLQALIPAGAAWAGKLIIDAVVQTSAQPGRGLMPVLPPLALGAGLAFAGVVLNSVRQFCQDALRDLLSLKISGRVMEKAISLDLETFETPHKQDMLHRASDDSTYRPLAMLQQTFGLLQNTITLITLLALMVRFSWWIVVLLLVTGLPALYLHSKYARQSFEMHRFRAPKWRRLMYLNMLITHGQFVKEIKLFGLGKLLLERFRQIHEQFLKENRSFGLRRNLGNAGLQLLGQAGYYGAYVYVIRQTLNGDLTLGDLTLYSAVLMQAPATGQNLMQTVANLYEQNLFIGNLFGFLALQPRIPQSGVGKSVPEVITKGYEFRNVYFRYPGAPSDVLQGISLKIRPGEKIALVGENGTGKTTLIKLLTRLYDPTEGCITLDGVDLREYDPGSLQKRIGVIFQDFVQYHMTARENIGFGRADAVDDFQKIQAAAEKSGAHAFLSAFPSGYETMLGRWFVTPGEQEGHDLSLGQWQKVALARAFMRDAPVLVLDEPTASLDARAEYEIFKQFRDLTADRTAILISHRFSTVRIADRILVLEQGQIKEEGSHEELLKAGGKYAMLFNLQAEGYR